MPFFPQAQLSRNHPGGSETSIHSLTLLFSGGSLILLSLNLGLVELPLLTSRRGRNDAALLEKHGHNRQDSFHQAPLGDPLSLEAGCHTMGKPMCTEGLHGDVPVEVPADSQHQMPKEWVKRSFETTPGPATISLKHHNTS